jgi:peroxiredoxin
MTIEVGQTLPEAKFKVMTADGPADRTTAEIFSGKKVVLVGVPGAFTPTCSMNHLPGFLDNLDTIKAKGVDEVAVVAVNDVWVMDAWAKSSGGKDKILFLADGNGTFAKAAGLEFDLSAPGFGTRNKRFAMIVENGVVKSLGVEDKPGVGVSGAAQILEQL